MNPDWTLEMQIKGLTKNAQAMSKEIKDLQLRCEYYEQLLLQLIMALQKAKVIVPVGQQEDNG
jgi:prefoldin subunit 5